MLFNIVFFILIKYFKKTKTNNAEMEILYCLKYKYLHRFTASLLI